MVDSAAIAEIIKMGKKLEPIELYYSIYFYALWIFSTTLTAITLYIVIFKRHVKIQAEFRPLIFHTNLSSALVLTGVMIWQPVTVPAYFGGYSLGVLGRFGQTGYLIGQWLTWTLAAHIGTVITISFLMQNFHMKVFGHNWLSDLFDWLIQRRLMWSVSNLSLLINAILCISPHLVIKYTAMDLNSFPELNEFAASHPSLILMPIFNNNAFLGVLLVVGSVMSVQFVLCLTANLLTFRAIRSTSGVVSQRTLEMQMAMYRLFTLRLLLIVFFLYASALALMLHIFQIFNFVYFPMICICFMSLYCPTSAVVGFVGLPPLRKSLQSGSFFRPGDSTSTRVQHLSNQHRRASEFTLGRRPSILPNY